MERHTALPSLDALVGSLTEPLALISASGIVITTSEPMRSLLGVTKQQTGTSHDIVSAVSSQCADPARATELLAAMEPPDEASFERVGGGTLTVRLTCLDDGTGTVLWRFGTSAQKPPHVEAKEVIEGTQDAILALDTDFRVLYMNETMERLWAIVGPDRKARGRILWEVFPEFVGSPVYDAYRRTMRDRAPRRVVQAAAGMAYEVSVYPAPNGILVSARDVTGEQIAVSVDRQGRARPAQDSRLGMAIADAEKVLIDVNQAFCDVTGYSREELIGSSFVPLIHPEDAHIAATSYRALLRGEMKSDEVELRLRRRDGSIRWVISWSEVNVTRDGSRQIVAYVQDMTDRKRALDMLVANHQKLVSAYDEERRKSEELRSLDDMKNAFLSAVSHDLRTPLTAILGIASTLDERGHQLDDETRAALTSRLRSNASRLARILTDLLDLDRLQRGILTATPRAIDLAALVSATLERSDLPRTHPITLELGSVEAEVDPAMVERILENLVVNAIRHTKAGTPITIETRAEPSHALLIVTDDGTGVAPEARDTIFEAFEQSSSARSHHDPGLGIGLSLVGRFVALHDGEVWLEDAPSGGARFCVRLPRRRAAGRPSPEAETRERAAG